MLAITGFSSCQEKEEVLRNDQVSEQALKQISALGFNTHGVVRIEEGYLVEGDIILTEKELQAASTTTALRVGEEEQYRTRNLVRSLPREITVSVDSRLPSRYVEAMNDAIARYNALDLRVSFRRVSSGSAADIRLTRPAGNPGYLASAGFPSEGDPYHRILVNVAELGQSPRRSYLASVLAHEIGHCIGFRHTDYMDRSYSCGGFPYNEGSADVGAIHIPGTPTGPSANSWMLACIGDGDNRPFTSNDRTALRYVY